jgi:hypothetical protein
VTGIAIGPGRRAKAPSGQEEGRRGRRTRNTQDAFTDRIFEQVDKDYGEGVLIAGSDAVNEKRVVIPWTPTLDIITSGGIEEGSAGSASPEMKKRGRRPPP